jgi:hypothetical protein
MALLLAMVFFSNVTLALSLDIHFCQGKVESMALFGQRATCQKAIDAESLEKEARQLPPCCQKKRTQSGVTISQKSCCENLQLFQDDVVDKASNDHSFQVTQTVVADAYFCMATLVYLDFGTEIKNVEIPPPPILLRQHSQELLQVYQI